MIHVLDTFVDESSDQTRKDVFCVAGFLAHEKFWKPLEGRWVKRLQADGVKYFSAKDCKSVQGPFKHLRKVHGSLEAARKVADSIRADLEDILVPPPDLPPSQWHGFGLAVVIPEYNYIRDNCPESRVFYGKDTTAAAYSQIMYEIVRVVRRKAKKFGVAYVIDQSNDFSKIIHAFKAMKVHHPVVGVSAKTCAPFDDKETPGLQMADLLASVSKDIALEWVASGKKRPEIGKWARNFESFGKWDADHMRRSLIRTVKSPRFSKGTLVPQPVSVKKTTKGERKRQRRELWKDKAANHSSTNSTQ